MRMPVTGGKAVTSGLLGHAPFLIQTSRPNVGLIIFAWFLVLLPCGLYRGKVGIQRDLMPCYGEAAMRCPG
jgi:hypothetical protein